MFRQYVIPYLVVGVSGLLVACSTMKDTGPDDYLNKARELIQAEEYQSAKQYIDSVRILFPKAYDKIREGIAIMREVDFSEQQRTLAYCDSLLKVRQNELPTASKQFVFQKDPQYESIGHYIPKTQLTENNYGRTYLQAKVDERGRLVLTSYYAGNKVINHTKIRASVKGGLFAESTAVPEDGALNYTFKDGGRQYEIVRFTNKTENGLINFILMHLEAPITIELVGKQKGSYQLTNQDKQALKATTNLSAILTDINRLLNEIRLSQAKLDYLYTKQHGVAFDDSLQ
ncbi:MAG: hypothetical protein BWY72_01359 [Bacteroidetes bacterium ADurb.Bin416]|jgi:hypothetical protein|nr:MAG: hypothetical protein BWY72_01359 [Bacteroidetes bacterium ADurb.Bin416]